MLPDFLALMIKKVNNPIITAPTPQATPIITGVLLSPGVGSGVGVDFALYVIVNEESELIVLVTFIVSLLVTSMGNKYDILINVTGGGLNGQAAACLHGISRALTQVDPNARPSLKANGYLTRDSRMVERKKYGQRGARRRFQFSKR